MPIFQIVFDFVYRIPHALFPFFPYSASHVFRTNIARSTGGEGCSTAGGCATCPFMKMNDLDALMDVASLADKSGAVSGECCFFLGGGGGKNCFAEG